jgi:subfamily B ATP-binding cassette protein MsbA
MVALPTMAVIVRFSSRYMRRRSQRVQEALGDVSHVSEEMIEGYSEIRMFGGEQYEAEKFKQCNYKNRNQAMNVVIAKNLSTSFVQIVGASVLATSIYLATSNHLVAANITPGSIVALLFAMVMLLKPLKDFTNVNNIIQQGIAGAQSVFELLDGQVEIDRGQKTLTRAQGKIEYRHVNFSYQRTNKPVLENINFVIQPGESIALVGRSGSGKSTLISLLPRFYELNSGGIFIDDINTQELKLANLRQQIALVSQRVVLFNDTIEHNIAYGSLNTLSEQALWEAIDRAHAREFIEKLPEGIDTIVGENGVLLSGGQRQRIAIARAILKDAPILVLDEATSSLDSHSERYIQAALDDLIKNRTTLVIAHRLSTIENANRIMVMEHGQIVETGSHKELLSNSSHYAELYRSQFRDETFKA